MNQYFPVLILALIAIFTGLLFILGHRLVTVKVNKNQKKIEPWECGVKPLQENSRQININYFLFALLFLVFDIETVLFFPLVVGLKSGGFLAFCELLFFLFLFFLGLYYIWKTKILILK